MRRQLQQRALAIQEKELGTNVGPILNNLASLHWNAGKYADAEHLQIAIRVIGRR